MTQVVVGLLWKGQVGMGWAEYGCVQLAEGDTATKCEFALARVAVKVGNSLVPKSNGYILVFGLQTYFKV